MPRIPTRARTVFRLAAVSAMLAATPLTAVVAEEPEAAPPALTKGEERLAKLLEGRVAGEPQSCIRTPPNMPMQTIDQTAYVFNRGSTIYVQRPRNPQQIRENEALTIRRNEALQLCSIDLANTVDPVLGFFTGVVQFTDFVPYTRVPQNR